MNIRQNIQKKGKPLEVKIPNETTVRTIEAVERGEDIHTVSIVDELFKKLNS